MVDQSPALEVTQCPSWAAALGYMGVAAAVCLSNWGSAVRNQRLLIFVSYFQLHRSSNAYRTAHLDHSPTQMGTWKAGISIVHTGIRHPSSVMKNVIPIVMAGVIGIYGLIVGVILGQAIVQPTNDRENVYSTFTGMAHLCAGLCCGVSGLAAGLCIGIVGDYGIRAVGYRASAITLFPTDKEAAAGYSTIPDSEETGGEDISGVSLLSMWI